MQRTRRYRLLTAILLVLAASAAAAPQGEYYGSGYTIISQEHGNDDLQATVYRQITPGTVRQALPQLLDGTGWRLADSHAADDRIYRLYNQPLPEHKLRIGPMPLDQALSWIAGDGWALVVDPVNRLVSFEVEARYDSRPPVGIHSRPAATSHTTDVAPAATPVYADLPPQGSFPAVQTAPDYSTTTYRTPTAAYPAPVREDWQSTLPQRLANNTHAPQPPREQRRSKTRKALRPAVTATGNDSAAAAVPHHTAVSNRRAVATTQKTATTAAAPVTKATPAKTSMTAADKAANEPAAKAAASESRPAAAPHPAAPVPDKADKKTVAPAVEKKTAQTAVKTADNKIAAPATANAEKTPTVAAEKAAAPAGHKKAAESSQADSPATAKPAADATAKPVPAATQPAAPAKAAPAPAKSEAPAPVLANPAKADGTAPAAAKPATAQDTAPQAKPAAAPENPATARVKTGYLPGPPPALIAKRTIHVPPQQRLRPPAAKAAHGETAASMTPPAAPAAAATPEDAP